MLNSWRNSQNYYPRLRTLNVFKLRGENSVRAEITVLAGLRIAKTIPKKPFLNPSQSLEQTARTDVVFANLDVNTMRFEVVEGITQPPIQRRRARAVPLFGYRKD